MEMASAGTGSVERHDIIIIGSGPAGYTAAIYAARAGLQPLVFEGSVTAGGALMTTTDVENFPGFADGIQGPELMEQMRAQAERFGAVLLAEDVTSVDLRAATKVIRTAEAEYSASAVVLALGSAYKKLGIINEELLSGHGLSWCATCDGFFFKGQRIAVVGGGDSALEEAMFLSRFAEKVTVVHRRGEFRASEIMQQRALADPKIEVIWHSEIDELFGDERLVGLRLRNRRTGEAQILDVTGLFIAIGHEPRSELVAGQIATDEHGYVLVDRPSSATNIKGVFACGDLVDSIYRQGITAAGSGCSAAMDAEKYLASVAHEASGGRSDPQLSPL